MSTSTITPVTCGTDSCTNTSHEISIAVSRPSIYRYRACIAGLDALAPHRISGLTDDRIHADATPNSGA